MNGLTHQMQIIENSVEIDSGGTELRAVLYRPEDKTVGGLVFCNPIFEERKTTCRALVETARVLCAGGIAVLRFDYRGCGDSPGPFPDFSFHDWLADIIAARDFLAQHVSPPWIGLLGLRVGAMLALRAATDNPGIALAVLWAPVTDGRAYVTEALRRKMAREMVTFGRGRARSSAVSDALETGGTVDFDGYPLSARLYRDLCGVSLPEIAAHPSGGDLLMVSVGHRQTATPAVAKLGDAFRDSGSRTTCRHVQMQPFWNLIGYVDCSVLMERTREWLLAWKRP